VLRISRGRHGFVCIAVSILPLERIHRFDGFLHVHVSGHGLGTKLLQGVLGLAGHAERAEMRRSLQAAN
jgi:hypothetical protein